MNCKSLMRNTVAMLAVGAVGVLTAGAVTAHAQDLQMLAASPPAQVSTDEITPTTRLILHDVNVRGASMKIDRNSRPVLDYAVRLLRQNPSEVVYVSGQESTMPRQAQAVARYLRQHGIASNRVVVQNVVATASETAGSNSAAGEGVVVLNLSAPGCANCAS
jgi:outer membrane protein OmpA-like peptidoglycan-associated protein